MNATDPTTPGGQHGPHLYRYRIVRQAAARAFSVEDLSDDEIQAALDYIIHTRIRTPVNPYTKAALANLNRAQSALFAEKRARRRRTT